MPEINLKSITMDLIKADEDYSLALTKLFPLELEFNEKLDDASISAPGASQGVRDSQAQQKMREDHNKLFINYHTAKLEAKQAWHRLDTLKVVSSNLRNLAYDE